MTTTLERIQRYLDERAAPYRIIEHAPAASADEYHAVLGTPYERQAKTILLRVKRPGEKGLAVVALQGQKRVDLDRVRELLDAKEVRLASRRQLTETTGCDFGELPPFGGLFGLPLLLDTALEDQDEVCFNAGALTVSIAMDPKVIAEVEQPVRY